MRNQQTTADAHHANPAASDLQAYEGRRNGKPPGRCFDIDGELLARLGLINRNVFVWHALNLMSCDYMISLAALDKNTIPYKTVTHFLVLEALCLMDKEDKERLRQIRPRWSERAQHLDWTALKKWLELTNCPPGYEPDFINFGIRGYRLMHPEEYAPIVDQVRQTLNAVIDQVRPAGIDFLEPDPYRLFVAGLEHADLDRLRRCPGCRKYFFAIRKDQIACSPVHANAERQRRHRAKNKTYEVNRKRNEAAKKRRRELHRLAVKKKNER